MLGIFGFLTADKIPNAVPTLNAFGISRPYDGEVMNPFQVEWGTPWAMETAKAAADAASAVASTTIVDTVSDAL